MPFLFTKGRTYTAIVRFIHFTLSLPFCSEGVAGHLLPPHFIPGTAQTWRRKYCRPETCLRQTANGKPIPETYPEIAAAAGTWRTAPPPHSPHTSKSPTPCQRTRLHPHPLLPAAAAPKNPATPSTRASPGSTASNSPRALPNQQKRRQSRERERRSRLPPLAPRMTTIRSSSRNRISSTVKAGRRDRSVLSSRARRAGTGFMR